MEQKKDKLWLCGAFNIAVCFSFVSWGKHKAMFAFHFTSIIRYIEMGYRILGLEPCFIHLQIYSKYNNNFILLKKDNKDNDKDNFLY